MRAQVSIQTKDANLGHQARSVPLILDGEVLHGRELAESPASPQGESK